MSEAILLVVGAILGVLASVALQEPIQIGLARLLGGLGPLRGTSLKGVWRSTYVYRSEGEQRYITQIVRMQQVGPFVVGHCCGSSGEHRHLIRGRVRDRIFTGVWHNVARNADHRGGLQLLLNPDGQAMRGKWIGFDRQHRIQHGDWTWEWLGDSLTDAEVQQALPGGPAGPQAGQP
jgi:hypothetical protein